MNFLCLFFIGAVAAIQKGEFPDDNQLLKCYTLCVMKAMRTVRKNRYNDIKYFMIKNNSIILLKITSISVSR